MSEERSIKSDKAIMELNLTLNEVSVEVAKARHRKAAQACIDTAKEVNESLERLQRVLREGNARREELRKPEDYSI